MPRIEKLTPEQEKLIPVWRERWREVGLDTSRIDHDKARQAVRELYKADGLKEPGLVLIAQSPLQALLMRAVMILLNKRDFEDQLSGPLRDQLWGQLRDQLSGQLGDQLSGPLRDQLWGQLRDQLSGQLRDQLWGQLKDQLSGQLRDQLGDQLSGQLWGQLRDQLSGQLGDQLSGQLWGQLWDQLRDQLSGQLYETVWFVGGWDSYWLAFYEAGRSVGAAYSKETTSRLDSYVNYAKRCGVAFLYSDIAFVSDRPDYLSFDDEQRLHAETGPAARWPDGFSIYAWHGTRLPGEWIENRATIDPVEILKAGNVEQRAAGAAMIGWPRIIQHLDRRVIDGDPNSDMGALIELTLPGLDEPGRFLQAQCPRNGTIVEGVPRTSDVDGLPINTALAAQAWRIGDPQSEYEHPPRRT